MKTFLAIQRAGLVRAQGQADHWQVDVVLPDQIVHCLAADPHNASILFAGTRTQGVLRSTDGGQSWTPSGLPGQVIKALAASRAEPGVVYAGTMPACLFVSRDSGETWTELDRFAASRRAGGGGRLLNRL